jgi:hypothetical protein
VLIVNVYVVPIREIQLILINDGAANTHTQTVVIKFKSKLKTSPSRAGQMADQKDQGQTNK